MGRLKAGKQLRTVPAPKEKLDAKSKASSSASLPTVPKLFAKAQGLVVQGDFDLARQFLDRILQQDPSHIEAYELLGIVQLELGDLDAARSTFLHLLEMPNTPASAHLYLAQLEDEPQTSLRHYEAAIETFTTQLKGKDTPVVDGREPPTEEELKSSIVQALCAMIEIWMSDLCMEESAEASCEALLSRAFAIDENSPEALQSLASCRMSQDRPDDARLAVERSWAQWKDLEPDDSRRPDLPQRLSLAKLFLELAQHYSELALFESALSILQDVLAADDQEVMGWYLEGWCLLLMSENLRVSAATADGVSWTDLAHDARECLDMCKNLHINQQHPDAQVLQHVEELLAEIVALNLPPRANDDDDDEVWVDDDEDEDGDVEMS
ncbi:TPR-like protein [Exidia glandulosa HHB12029]|uniref:TPR-like protein n=1 Tax=Exidia glandulosa HHB12029 TaxID=1314781 RepID=A0A165K654_EXIGL|nr:TPR-like protein [Exidia glandulosa HHB12029]